MSQYAPQSHSLPAYDPYSRCIRDRKTALAAYRNPPIAYLATIDLDRTAIYIVWSSMREIDISELLTLSQTCARQADVLRTSPPTEWPRCFAAALGPLDHEPSAAVRGQLTRTAILTSVMVFVLHELIGPALDAARLLDDLLSVGDGADRASRVESTVGKHLRMITRTTLARTVQAQRMVRYINEHLDDPITVDALVRATGCSRWQLAAMVYAHAGVSVREYVTMQRIRKAVELLLRSEKASVAMVEVGYHNKTSFNRAFKWVTGKMPRDFLSIHRGSRYGRASQRDSHGLAST